MKKIKGYKVVKKAGEFYIEKESHHYYSLNAKTEKQARKAVNKYHQNSLKSKKELKEANGSIVGALLNNL